MLTMEEKAAWIAEREARNQKIKDRIRAAGISYPMGWDGMRWDRARKTSGKTG